MSTRYFNKDGTVKAATLSRSVGGDQVYSIFGWETSKSTGTSAVEMNTVRLKPVKYETDISAGTRTLANSGNPTPRSRPGSAKRRDEIAGSNIFSDGTSCHQAPGSHAARVREMQGVFKGAGLASQETGPFNPMQGAGCKKRCSGPAEVGIFKAANLVLPVRPVSAYKRAALGGTYVFRDDTSSIPKQWKPVSSALKVCWDNSSKIVDAPKRHTRPGVAAGRIPVGGYDQVVFG